MYPNIYLCSNNSVLHFWSKFSWSLLATLNLIVNYQFSCPVKLAFHSNIVYCVRSVFWNIFSKVVRTPGNKDVNMYHFCAIQQPSWYFAWPLASNVVLSSVHGIINNIINDIKWGERWENSFVIRQTSWRWDSVPSEAEMCQSSQLISWCCELQRRLLNVRFIMHFQYYFRIWGTFT